MTALARRFDRDPPARGYVWWYLDAISDDGAFGLTVILFIGSVFSPYYAMSDRAQPRDHCAVNVALYGPRAARWAMTERRAKDLRTGADVFQAGPSAARWDGDRLVVDVNERGAPLPRRLCGRITVQPEAFADQTFSLDPNGRHQWGPIAPRARVDVAMSAPDLAWSGEGYLDSNWGDEPLEDGFRFWDWSRASLSDGSACVLYNLDFPDGEGRTTALRWRKTGFEAVEPPPLAKLPKGVWGVSRRLRADGGEAGLVRACVDAPFYTRSLVRARYLGEEALAMHESLALDRFQRRWVRALLPFRMPRGWWFG